MPILSPPAITIQQVELREILPLRAFFLEENPVQIRYDSCHQRGWSTLYGIYNSQKILVGYGAVKGRDELADRDAVFEFYLVSTYHKWSEAIFQKLLERTVVTYVESQTNETLLTALLYRNCRESYADTILFADQRSTSHVLPDVTFRKRRPEDDVFGLAPKDAGDYVLERSGLIVATGGYLTHYNPPFADLYMETHPDFRNRGFASYLLQEVKKECYAASYTPAARCNLDNSASRSTLLKAGFRICGFMLVGRL